MTAAHESLREAIRLASRGLIEREALIELVVLAAVAEEHLLVIGPPGTAKSEAVRRIARCLGGRYFEYLLGRFTEPSELFGPVDLRKLREGVVETQTDGMLPEADVAFLDEVFLGSTAILNTLLAILNERTFRRGHTHRACPLRVCVGAANALPEDESLAAFADRFLVRVFVSPIPDDRLEELLGGGGRLGAPPEPRATIEELAAVTAAARGVDLEGVRPTLAHLVRLLRKNGIGLSDRRLVKIQKLVAAAAALGGRAIASDADLWPILYAVPTVEAQSVAREILRDVLAESQSEALPAAAEEAALGPRARAHRIAAAAKELLAQRPAEERALEGWRLKLEGVARELDAGFASEALTEELRAVRAQIVEALAPAAA